MQSVALRQTAQPVPSGLERREEWPAVRSSHAGRSLLVVSVVLLAAGVFAGAALVLSGLLLGNLLVGLLGVADVAVALRLGAVLVTLRATEATERAG